MVSGGWTSPVEDVDVQRARSFWLGEVLHAHHTIFQENALRRKTALVKRVPSYLRQSGGMGAGNMDKDCSPLLVSLYLHNASTCTTVEYSTDLITQANGVFV